MFVMTGGQLAGGPDIGLALLRHVNRIYQEFKHHFTSKHEKIPKTIKGLDGVYSLVGLSD